MAQHLYDPTQVESKWQAWWQQNGTNEIDLAAAKNPYYVLMMFPYPSAEGLHVGNVYAFTGADIHGRFKRLQGYDVFEPIGFDAFGIHSENFAMKVNRHPAELIPANIANFTRQLKMMGFMFDWRRTVDTTSPEYYKWTQWIFLQLYKAGLVYRDVKEVNFCPECGTVISDEQKNPDGTCERHPETMVERRALPCWFFRITNFADRLVNNHLNKKIDWSQRTVVDQVKWIGASHGAEVDFAVQNAPAGTPAIRVFTTRPDTLFGATFMVLSPEHPLVETITTPAQAAAVKAYQTTCAAKSDEERTTDTKEKTGIFTGAHAINPLTGAPIPVWIADYVLMGYGTGAIMAVPSGDHRDFAFAQNFNLPVVAIIDPDFSAFEPEMISGTSTEEKTPEQLRAEVLAGKAAWSGPGRMINSANATLDLNGLAKEDAIAKTTAWLSAQHLGNAKTQYRLRDWGISRQRYWGPPIPVWYDEEGNHHPIPESELPVQLPEMTDFRPKGDGKGPLANRPDWYNYTAADGRKGRRETDVMDNFLDSAWYFLRYISSNDPTQAWDPALVKQWMPIDMYIGGNEHAVLHLMYTRFLCMALHQAGVLDMGNELADPGEPFKKFRAHGLLIKDGSKMSKSRGNVVNPDEFVAEHGCDTLRTYLMFLGPYEQGGDFRLAQISGIRRFFNRLYDYYFNDAKQVVAEEELPKPLRVKMHQVIQKVTKDLETETESDPIGYNTAIAMLMELLNECKSHDVTSRSLQEALVTMIAPFAPHLAEEIWQGALGNTRSVWSAKWPSFDASLTTSDTVEIVVQINGKIRERLVVARSASKEELEQLARGTAAVQNETKNGAEVRKVIVVPGSLINVIVK
ncbi:MAG: leucine--tRNA ligase [Candidatus Sumerlaeia bacterium]|nr:leucine--tRNA ligase [Candidatus Sumerlaeia bacterium]